MENQIKHHLSDDILMGYAAGTLPEAFNLMVATHISLCDTCRARAESYDAVGGSVLDGSSESASPMNSDSFAATMTLIELITNLA